MVQTFNDQIIIIGCGFGGLGMAIQLKKFGYNNFTILEKAGSLGGTWRDNTYPGAACDVPSHVYSYSFAPNAKWSKMFSPQKEIYNYLQECAKRFGIWPHICFNSPVEATTFDELSGMWTVKIKGGTSTQCRYLIVSTGGLSKAKHPMIEGLENFQGEVFHSAEWNHQFQLAGSRVAVIGTGASAIQIVPAIAPVVDSLTLFQRTPAWVLPKPDRDFTKSELYWFERLGITQKLMRAFLYWSFEMRGIGLLKPSLMKFAQKQAIKYLNHRVHNPLTREKLTPKYTMGCKRILMSNDYLATFNRVNVNLETDPIVSANNNGILTKNGTKYEFDAIICATGFQVAEQCAPFPIIGLQNKNLVTEWKSGAQAFLGTSVSGFPNLFMITGPNTGLGHNSIVYMMEAQYTYIVGALDALIKAQAKFADVRREIQEKYNDKIQSRFKGTVWNQGGCVSWYHTKEGRNVTLWPGFSFAFKNHTKHFDISLYNVQASEGEEQNIDLKYTVGQ